MEDYDVSREKTDEDGFFNHLIVFFGFVAILGKKPEIPVIVLDQQHGIYEYKQDQGILGV